MIVSKIWQIGKSCVITLPKAVLEKAKMKKGDVIKLEVKEGNKVYVEKVNFTKN